MREDFVVSSFSTLTRHILYISWYFSTSKQEQNMAAIHSSGSMPSRYFSVYLCLKVS